MPLDATVGGLSANSYATIAIADSYAAERIGDLATAFIALVDSVKEQLLISATRRLDQEFFAGYKANNSQALKFPRGGIYNEDGRSYEFDEIPNPIQFATIELAMVLTGQPELLEDTGLEQFAAVAVGDLNVTPSTRLAGTLPQQVIRFISHLLDVGTVGAGTLRKVRG